MKTLIHWPLLCCVALLASSTPAFAQPAVLTGHIFGAGPQTIYLVRSRDFVDYKEWLWAVDSFQLKEDGLFHFSIPAEKPDFFQICKKGGGFVTPELFLGNGDSLDIERHLEDYNIPARYAGDRAGAYEYGPLVYNFRQTDSLLQIGRYDMLSMDQEDFLSLMKERRSKEQVFLEAYFQGHPDWEPIKSSYTAEAGYLDGQDYFDYLQYHNYYANDTFLYLRADSSFYGFLDEIDLNNQEFHYETSYQRFLGAYLEDLFVREFTEYPDSLKRSKEFLLKLELIKKHLNGIARDVALYSLSDDFSHGLALEDFFEQAEILKSYFRENYTDEGTYRKFLKVLSRFEPLRPGNPAPELALPSIGGDTVRLSDFLGKVVYIDFWGTWCYPCLQELPHSLDLQEKLKNEDVVFVYIGLESAGQVQEWREFVQGQRLFDYAPFLKQMVYPGVQLLAERQFGNPALEPYRINFAPTYLLIDRQGRLVSARAPRPSDPGIEQKLRELVEKQ